MRLLDDPGILNGDHTDAMHWSTWRSRGVITERHVGIGMPFSSIPSVLYVIFERCLRSLGKPSLQETLFSSSLIQDQTKTNLSPLLLSEYFIFLHRS